MNVRAPISNAPRESGDGGVEGLPLERGHGSAAGAQAQTPVSRGAAGIGVEGIDGTCGTCSLWVPENVPGYGSCPHRGAGMMSSRLAYCVVEPIRWKKASPEEARRAAQRGIDLAVSAAERAEPGWSDVALEFVRTYAKVHAGKHYIGHDIVAASIAANVPQPPNPRAWGGPIQRAVRAGYIRRVNGNATAPDPNRHTNPVPLWESGEAVKEAA